MLISHETPSHFAIREHSTITKADTTLTAPYRLVGSLQLVALMLLAANCDLRLNSAAFLRSSEMELKDILTSVFGFFSHIFDDVFKLLSPVSPNVSAALLIVIVAVLLGLLIYFFVIIDGVVRRRHGHDEVGRPSRSDIETDTEDEQNDDEEDYSGSGKLAQCRRRLADARAKLRQMRNDPSYNQIERVYFSVNGITNSGLILSSSLLLFEFFKTKNRPPVAAIMVSAEVGRVIGVIAFTLLIAAIVVYLSHKPGGRSYERINRAFVISFILCAASFAVFVTVVSPW
jgi:hypothetical protein